MPQIELTDAIDQLQKSYYAYMTSLNVILNFGESNIEPLIAALNHKGASPIAEALGLMMHTPASEKAYPMLVGWITIQSPLYPAAFEAMVLAGDRSAPYVFDQIRQFAENNDPFSVANLFDLAIRYSDALIPRVVEIAESLLDSESPPLRVCGAEAIWQVGRPFGLVAREHLISRLEIELIDFVKRSISVALERLG